ncbi:nicotinamide N-methyltransferase-like [Ornithodoros turicata]|uniref:nicotinamide N-methyltransferase-like n=1 Tax=Ornithodoros turicata TaxID=34597 RepID=UPI003138884E
MDYDKLKQQYRNEFDPGSYQDMVMKLDFLYLFYQREVNELLRRDVFKNSATLLEFGCGPTPFSMFPMTKKFHEVVLCEYLEQNRRAVQKWVNNEADALDWSFLAESQALLEGYSDLKTGCSEVEERTRRAIKHIIPCDVYDMGVMPKEHRIEYDVLFTSLCFEGAAVDLEAYNSVVSNVTQLVKPGGVIVQCGVLKCKTYTVGQAVFDAMYLTEDIVKGALEKAGFEIKNWKVDEAKTAKDMDYEYDGAFIVVATKL